MGSCTDGDFKCRYSAPHITPAGFGVAVMIIGLVADFVLLITGAYMQP